VEATALGLHQGAQYRIVVKAKNVAGTSDASEELRVALGRVPAQPAAPAKVEAQSSETAIMVEWAAAPDIDGVPTEGYSLYMDDGAQGDMKVVYDGREHPQTRQFLVTALTTGQPYRFAISAHNFNGESP
jgi:hypothetical protein